MDLNASILVDTIFLLINENSEYTRKIANELIFLFKESKVIDTDDSEVIRFYIRILHRIISETIDKTHMDDLRSMMLKMKSEAIFASHKDLLLDLEKTILDPGVMEKDKLDKLKRNVCLAIAISKRDKTLKKSFTRLQRLKGEDNPDIRFQLFKEFESEFGGDESGSTGTYSGPKASSSVLSSDRDALKAAFVKQKDRRSGEGVIKLGQQALNKAFGSNGGPCKGESICIVAPSHHGKSVFLLMLAYWAAAYNTFSEIDGKKPLIYIASTENEVHENFGLIYNKIYFEKNGELPPKDISVEDKVDAVCDFFESRGVDILIEFYTEFEFSAEDFVERLKVLMDSGYYIPIAVLDYLTHTRLPKTGREDQAIREVYSRVCGFCKQHGICFATVHQYTRSGMIALNDKIDRVKSMNPGGVMGGYDAFREVDVVFYLFKEKNHSNDVYITMLLDKHRYDTSTPESDKYFAYKLEGGAIKDDFGMEKSTAVKDIYTEGIDLANGYQKNTDAPSAKTQENDDLF